MSQARVERLQDAQQAAAEFAVGDERSKLVGKGLGQAAGRRREGDLGDPIVGDAVFLGRFLKYVAVEHTIRPEMDLSQKELCWNWGRSVRPTVSRVEQPVRSVFVAPGIQQK